MKYLSKSFLAAMLDAILNFSMKNLIPLMGTQGKNGKEEGVERNRFSSGLLHF